MFNVRQSAKQLDVQKNVLLNGFDSSTEDEHKFKPIDTQNFSCTITGEAVVETVKLRFDLEMGAALSACCTCCFRCFESEAQVYSEIVATAQRLTLRGPRKKVQV